MCSRASLGQKAGIEPKRDRGDAARTATPNPRRIHSPALSERFIAAKTRPPMSRATCERCRGSERHRRKAATKSVHWPPAAPRRSAPGRGSARRRAPKAGRWRRRAERTGQTDEPARLSAWPIATGARRQRPTVVSASRKIYGNSSVMPNNPSSTMAANRPYWLAWTAHPPPTAASVATAAKVDAMPARSGRPLLTKG